ncbi:MAG TPA: phage baseplate assembly protein V, partial [Aliidongia sp.]|uniref:phage baseplate assembly protein V n=1 Tax=Aliidongia sp. TaxID=1914230 RepID=UPI002DDD7B47
MMHERFHHFVRPLMRRVMLMVARVAIAHVDDSGTMQTVQVRGLGPEPLKMPRIRHFGFSSNPPAGSQGVAVFLGGLRSNGIMIGEEDPKSRPLNLMPGEVMVYSADGSFLHFKNGKLGELVCESLKITASVGVRMETPLLAVTGDVLDNCDTQTTSMKIGREVYNAHNHGNVQAG